MFAEHRQEWSFSGEGTCFFFVFFDVFFCFFLGCFCCFFWGVFFFFWGGGCFVFFGSLVFPLVLLRLFFGSSLVCLRRLGGF